MNAAVSAPSTNANSAQRAGDILWAVTLLGVWFWAFRSMAIWWNYSASYEYGFVVPWIALFLVWQRLRRDPACLDSPPARVTPLVAVVVPALAWGILFVGELLRQIDSMWRPVSWLFALGATLLTGAWVLRRGGWRLFRELAFPLLFTWTALPWPGFLDDPLTMKLRSVVTVATVQALHACGIGAVQEINVIHLANGPVGVEDACSGIVSLHSSLMAALFLGEFLWLGWGRRLVLIVGACTFAMVGNLLRTFTLCWLVNRYGISAVPEHHDRLGTIASIGIFFAVLGLAWLLARWKRKAPQVLAPPDVAWRLFAGGQTRVGSGAFTLAAFAGIPVIAIAWFTLRPEGGARVQETPLWAFRPQEAPAGWRVEPVPILDSQKATLGFTVGSAWMVQHPRGASVQIYHFFWGAERSGLPYAHTPDVCMSYIGWTQPGPAKNVHLPLRDTDHLARSFRFERGGLEITALHTFWRGGEPGLTGNEIYDNRRLARLPLLVSGPRLFGQEELLVFVAGLEDEAARLALASEVLGQLLIRAGAGAIPATAAR